jgi:hypothetical protein
MPRYILKASAVRKYICEVTAKDEHEALEKACMQDLWKVEDESGWQDDSCTEIKDEVKSLDEVKDGGTK